MKQNILTSVGIILSFVIAIGGWALIGMLIDIRSDLLMSETGISPIAMPMQLPLTDDDDDTQDESAYTRPLLTEQEIVSILRNHAAVGREMPHEPTREQIDMLQAVEIARDWLRFIGERLDVHDNAFTFFDQSAHLSQNQQRGSDGFLPPEYSFWTVTFIGRFVNVTMLINAVEGQVWKTEISLTQHAVPITAEWYVSLTPYEMDASDMDWDAVIFFETTSDNANNMLVEFMSVIGIDAGDIAFIRPAPPIGPWPWPLMVTMQRVFADGDAYAAMRIYGASSEGNIWFIHNFSMYINVVNERWF